MKRELLVLFAVMFAFVLIGAASLQGGLVILALPLLAYLASAAHQRPQQPAKLEVTRKIEPERAVQGMPVQVSLKLTNQGEVVEQVCIRDLFSKKIQTEDGITSLMAALEPGEKLEMAYTISAFRGTYKDFETVVQTQETLDCFEINARYPNLSHFVIRPEGEQIKPIRIRPPRTHGFAGSLSSRRAGTGVDFFTTREYQAGDPLRRINWRQSTRADRQIFTNTFEQEQVADVGIILDERQRVNLSTASSALFEYSVHAAATLARRFIADGHRVSLLVYGTGRKRVYPGYGKVQEDRILNTLSSVTPILNFALSNLNYMPVRFFSPGSQIVMISPLVMEDIAYIKKMLARGYAVMVLSPDPISFEAEAYHDRSSPAYRLAFAERQLMLHQLSQSGAQVINWQVHESLETVLQRASVDAHRILRNIKAGA